MLPPQDQEAQVARKKRRNTSRVQTRSIAGASVEVTGSSKCGSMHGGMRTASCIRLRCANLMVMLLAGHPEEAG